MKQAPNKFGKYQCPCCGYYTFQEPVDNHFDICPVCYWEDDGVQLHNPTYEGGANQVSLLEARNNYKKYGVIEPGFRSHNRTPFPDELPD
ncbi:CPCC family cysteine-rich protein [Spirosoma linguale]|uniref:Hydrolase n=1 Tax=Spirosoma linguale (strain ATCC 33905 / DSM 74 / LMG 10896 / Claus 1) TaxID=504472 RepID=D2QME3_SPILD|nr:hydrolase [Spirosoma linguale DSM 74]